MKILVTGAQGQVGRALSVMAPPGAVLIPVSHAELDIGDFPAVEAFVASNRPGVIINAAAYTAVDKAESEAELAHRVNATGPANLARVASLHGARLLHISTDFVFDGRSSVPYAPQDATAPLSVYGRTKLQGEQAVREHLPEAVVLRTSWVYASSGKNFLLTMLRLMKERGSVRVVGDQVGSPTSANSLARALWAFVARPETSGTFHWTDSGVASWYDFAVAIAEYGHDLRLLPASVEVRPIATEEYPTPARRPPFSVLDKRQTVQALEMTPPHWREALRHVMKELRVA